MSYQLPYPLVEQASVSVQAGFPASGSHAHTLVQACALAYCAVCTLQGLRLAFWPNSHPVDPLGHPVLDLFGLVQYLLIAFLGTTLFLPFGLVLQILTLLAQCLYLLIAFLVLHYFLSFGLPFGLVITEILLQILTICSIFQKGRCSRFWLPSVTTVLSGVKAP